jgi:lactoylglutathione lyase
MSNAHPATAGIDHLGLAVSDLESSVHFFVECLGWKIVGENPVYPAKFVSDGLVRLTLWQLDTSDGYEAFDRHKNVGLHHLALKVTSLEALEAIHARVSAWPGVKVEFAPEPAYQGPRVHCMVYEPSGFRLEFIYTPAA